MERWLALVLVVSMVAVPVAPASAETQCVHPAPSDYVASATVTEADDGAVRATYSIDPETPQFNVSLGSVGEVVATDGFQKVGDSRYQWDGQTGSPTIVYQPEQNWTSGSPEGRVVQLPRHSHDIDVSAAIGVAGQRLALLGSNADTYTTENGCEEITLVVPCETNVEEKPRDVIDVLSWSAEDLDVGHRQDSVTVFAVEEPPDGTAGVAFSNGDVVVYDQSPLDGEGTTWTHEYVHTRQGWSDTNQTAWLSEATAEYYAARLAVEQGTADREEFRESIGGDINDSTVLSEPDTWGEKDEYEKGSLVIAALDQRIREAGPYTFEDVMRAMNNDTGALTHQEFIDAVENHSDGETAAWADEVVSSTGTVSYERDLPDGLEPTWGERIDRRLEGIGEWFARLQDDSACE